MVKSKTFHLLVLLGFAGVSVYASPFNHDVVLDGRPIEYTADDLRGTFIGESAWGDVGTITNLYVTWDDTYLYVALQGWQFGNKLVVMLDVDPGEATGATSTTNWADTQPAHIGFNAVGWQAADASGIEFGLDYMIASEGFFNDILRIRYDGVDTPDTNNVDLIFSAGNGATPQGSDVDMVILADDSDCRLKGLEARIPWSEIYTEDGRFGIVGDGQIVPTNAVIRVFANVHNNDFSNSASSPDTIPPHDGTHFNTNLNLITTSLYIDIPIDTAGDGLPDNFSMGENPPFLIDVLGKVDGEIVYARFNREVTTESVTNTLNWLVNGLNPVGITNPSPDTAFLFLSEPLPSNGIVHVEADGVADANLLSRPSALCLTPATTGLDEPLTVRFVLETESGMGEWEPGSDAHNATAFFLNGDSPLEWGYPPSMNAPVDQHLSGTLYYRDVIFPPGTPLELNFKFSALLPTGTNNYEAIRLDNYMDAARRITLDPNAPDGYMVVTNHLGAAAGPLRGPGEEDAYADLYEDWFRGDAGVRQRKTITFQLDLSEYDLDRIERVLIQGTDPLRGFNVNEIGISDWAGQPSVGWANGGLTLFDDGTHGDAVAGDGIFSRTWSFTEDGRDTALVEGSPWDLVGGASSTSPYGGGAAWFRDRSPRSFKYQFYVVNEFGDVLNSPGFDVEVYLEPGIGTDIVMPPAEWLGDAPDVGQDRFNPAIADPISAPTVPTAMVVPGSLTLAYENQPDQILHVVDVTDDLIAGFRHYGQYLPLVNSGDAVIPLGVDDDVLFARVRAERGKRSRGVQWSPNPVPETGGVVRIYFQQQNTAFAGDRNVWIVGPFTSWASNPQPMTFAGDAAWYYDLTVGPGDGPTIPFKLFKPGSPDIYWGREGANQGPDYLLYRGPDAFVTWTPYQPAPGEVITVTYDAETGPFDDGRPVFIHLGFDDGWANTATRAMTNIVDSALWEYAVTVPTNVNTSVNWVFNDNSGNWHSEGDNDGRAWRAFLAPVGE